MVLEAKLDLFINKLFRSMNFVSGDVQLGKSIALHKNLDDRNYGYA